MPIYEPRSGPFQKREILQRKIDDLNRFIVNENSSEKISNSSEKVRIAMLNLLKAKAVLMKSYNEVNDSAKRLNERENIKNETIIWNKMSEQEIISYCKD